MEAIIGYKFLVIEMKAFVLSQELLRAGTSIGAKINETVSGKTKWDFVNNLSITIKNTRKTLYQLKFLKNSGNVEKNYFHNKGESCEEKDSILSSIF